MGWACPVCTYLNPNVDVVVSKMCDMCGTTARGEPASSSSAKLQLKPTNSNHNKKSSASKQTTLSFLGPASKKKPSTSTSFGSSVAAAAASKPLATTTTRKQQPQTTTKKRKAPSSSSASASVASFFSSSKSNTNNMISTPWTVQTDVPYDRLWQRSQEVLQRIFQLESLRPLQQPVVQTCLQRRNQMVVLATGGGKSLCYQLPACVLGGVTLVVSPLIALMQDQTQFLNQKGIAAAYLSSTTQTATERATIVKRLLQQQNYKSKDQQQQSSYTILYITPESIQTEHFRAHILKTLHQQQRLALFAIDEAHCISSWGHDFRSAYRKLSYLREAFPDVPCMALTATATPKVIQDIRTNLKFNDSVPLHVGSFDRPNIFYKVRYKDAFLLPQNKKNPLQDLTAFVEEQHSSSTSSTSNNVSGIIYVHKREDTQMIATYLSQHTSLTAAAYHAGLSKAVRASVLEGWSSSKIHIAVATVAFGMGIDVAHVRYVVHWNVPKTMEGLYQESGRAGRDGWPAISLVYYAQDDVDRFRYLLTLQQNQQQQRNGKGNSKTSTTSNRALEALQEIVQYCLDPSCRRKRLVQHFGGTAIQVDCGKTCDYCYHPKKVERAIQSAKLSSSQQQHRYDGNQTQQQASWDGQWSKPHGDDSGLLLMDDDDASDWGDHNNYHNDGDFVNGLQITGPLSASSTSDTNNYSSKSNQNTKQAPAGFVKASSILDKYEAMECKSGGGSSTSSGFVHFKTKTQRTKHGADTSTTSSEAAGTSSRQVPIVIPEHLRASAPDPLQHFETKKKSTTTSTTRTSAQVAASIAEKQKDLAKTRQELQDRLKALQAKKKMKNGGGGDRNSASSMVPTPPPPSFGGSKKQQR